MTSTAQKEPIVRAEGVSVGYGEELILRDISFEVSPGEVFVILGGSGCGKSTLLRHLVGLQDPVAGRILIGGRDLVRAEPEERRRIMTGFGVMYQGGALFGSMTLIENVRLPLEEHTNLSSSAMDFVARLKLRLVGLEAFAGHMPAEISGGMKKRAAIARAMALDPPLLFLDEPSAGLDPITSAELDQLILSLARNMGLTFVVVTHELPSIYTIADRVIMLDKATKTAIAEGDPRRLRDDSPNPWVRRFFNREIAVTEAPSV